MSIAHCTRASPIVVLFVLLFGGCSTRLDLVDGLYSANQSVLSNGCNFEPFPPGGSGEVGITSRSGFPHVRRMIAIDWASSGLPEVAWAFEVENGDTFELRESVSDFELAPGCVGYVTYWYDGTIYAADELSVQQTVEFANSSCVLNACLGEFVYDFLLVQ